MTVLTHDLIENGRSKRGGWSLAQLRCLGVNGFKTGWKRGLVGKAVGDDDYRRFLSLKDQHLESDGVEEKTLSLADYDMAVHHHEAATEQIDDAAFHVDAIKRAVGGTLGSTAQEISKELRSLAARLSFLLESINRTVESGR